MSLSSAVTSLRRMLIAEIQKRTRDHFVAALTQLMLAASLWGHGVWIQAMGLPVKLEQDSNPHSQWHDVRSVDRPAYTTGNPASMPAPQQPASLPPSTTCYPTGAVAPEEPLLHLVAAQRYQF